MPSKSVRVGTSDRLLRSGDRESRRKLTVSPVSLDRLVRSQRPAERLKVHNREVEGDVVLGGARVGCYRKLV
jgi:hypothetical protein